jgi:hypothetical protein
MTTAATQDRSCLTSLMNEGDEAIKTLATSAYGVASCIWVRPILTMSLHACGVMSAIFFRGGNVCGKVNLTARRSHGIKACWRTA